ncbi:MAG: DNA-3-methyladenine glycosylase I [Hyphomicrobiales bacterium]|nr:DNA-3-methyladenine glycosylase I [Hyphomicrobiales bacterium]
MKQRCEWCGADPLYVRYHDEEWGVAQTNPQALFEKIVLEGFQAGLSWITILRKREHFRRAFDGFDAEKIAAYGPEKIAELAVDARIIRSRAKIEAAIGNARAYLDVAEREDFARFMWSFTGGAAVQIKFRERADVPTQTPASKAMSKALKTRGFRFVGPTTMYALMQSCGMVNDHFVSCIRYAECADITPVFAE